MNADVASQIEELSTMLCERESQIASLHKRMAAVEPWQGKGADARSVDL
jgi:hypothetical protein